MPRLQEEKPIEVGPKGWPGFGKDFKEDTIVVFLALNGGADKDGPTSVTNR